MNWYQSYCAWWHLLTLLHADFLATDASPPYVDQGHTSPLFPCAFVLREIACFRHRWEDDKQKKLF